METIIQTPIFFSLFFVGKHKMAPGSVVVQQCSVMTENIAACFCLPRERHSN